MTESPDKKELEAIVQRIYEYAAELRFKEKKSPEEVKQALIDQGLSEENAATIVENLETQLQEHNTNAGQKDMIMGALWFFGGLLVTLMTYSAASGGGRYVVAWGAVVFGAVQFFRGLAKRSAAK